MNKPPIPSEILSPLIDEAGLPTRSLPDKSIRPLYYAVTRLKGKIIAEKKSKSASWQGSNDPDWKAVREILDTAMEGRNFSALDEFLKAWQKTEGPQFVTTIKIRGQESEVLNFAGPPLNERARRPVTVAIIEAIQQVQLKTGYAPCRQEVLDEMSERGHAIDDTELSSQLTAMRLNDYLTPG